MPSLIIIVSSTEILFALLTVRLMNTVSGPLTSFKKNNTEVKRMYTFYIVFTYINFKEL